MKTIETPWLKLSRFLGIGFGIPFTLLGIFLYFNLDYSWQHHERG